MTPAELAADLRSRINPAYAAQLGTESYERRLCAEVIEELVAELESLQPVAKVVLTETLRLPCMQWLDLDKQFEMKDGQVLYAAMETAP